ncbi:hypothetical protein C8R47DRAFT_1000069 [Mycena vitilis]|nr:hypothetical protein C8R47DRAFT_1024958 [Mycena vitilis]KAJ6518173.1 hypothetical protein C8R47DRAFT_1000069 [Mycena vitilis]
MSGNQNYKSATDIVDQGIRYGRPVGEQPGPSPVTLNTVVIEDASAGPDEATGPTNEFPGATSKDVAASTGQPGSGMSSKELHHNGQPGRKREKLGFDQYGTSSKDVEA